MERITHAEGWIAVLFGSQSIGRLGVLVSSFLFERCTYKYNWLSCNKALNITLQLKALLNTPQLNALSVSTYTMMHSDTHNPQFTDIFFTEFSCKHIILNIFLLQVHINCHKPRFSRWVTVLPLVLLWNLLEE
jgi:hypothetical protein